MRDLDLVAPARPQNGKHRHAPIVGRQGRGLDVSGFVAEDDRRVGERLSLGAFDLDGQPARLCDDRQG